MHSTTTLLRCLLAAALLAACSDASRTADLAIPPEVRDNARHWPLPGRDYANSRATFDSRIDSTNVASLTPVWQVELPGPGVLRQRGRGSDRHRRHGLHRRPGERCARDRPGERRRALAALARAHTDGVDIQPTVYSNLVFASSVPISLEGVYCGGDRGILFALREDTGEVARTFDTVDSPDLWGNPEVNSGGGAWYPPAIDTERGRICWAVANPASFPGTAEFPNGTSRPGPNLYTNTVVTLDVRTGALDWFRQAIPHDIFDHDLIHTLLVDIGEGAARRRVVVATGKGGKVIGHDIETGEVLWTTPVGIHQNDDLTALDGPTEVLPGTFGGVLTPPAAADGVVYVATLNAPSIVEPNVPEILGGNIGTMDGQVVAIDAASEAIVWDVTVPGDPLGGTTVVNDLVLTATFQGKIPALDRRTGRTVWSRDAPGGINCPPAVAGDECPGRSGSPDGPSCSPSR